MHACSGPDSVYYVVFHSFWMAGWGLWEYIGIGIIIAFLG